MIIENLTTQENQVTAAIGSGFIAWLTDDHTVVIGLPKVSENVRKERFPEFVICFGWKCRQQQQQQQQQHISVTFFFNIQKIEESLRSRKTWFEDITQSQPLAPIRTENNSLPLKINPKKKNVMRIWKWTVIDAKYYTKLTAIKNMKHARYYL